jgi:hypothetical protein
MCVMYTYVCMYVCVLVCIVIIRCLHVCMYVCMIYLTVPTLSCIQLSAGGSFLTIYFLRNIFRCMYVLLYSLPLCNSVHFLFNFRINP